MTKASRLCPSISPSKRWQRMPHPPTAPGKEAPGWGGKSEHDAYLSSFPRGYGEERCLSRVASHQTVTWPENWSRQSLQWPC